MSSSDDFSFNAEQIEDDGFDTFETKSNKPKGQVLTRRNMINSKTDPDLIVKDPPIRAINGDSHINSINDPNVLKNLKISQEKENKALKFELEGYEKIIALQGADIAKKEAEVDLKEDLEIIESLKKELKARAEEEKSLRETARTSKKYAISYYNKCAFIEANRVLLGLNEQSIDKHTNANSDNNNNDKVIKDSEFDDFSEEEEKIEESEKNTKKQTNLQKIMDKYIIQCSKKDETHVTPSTSYSTRSNKGLTKKSSNNNIKLTSNTQKEKMNNINLDSMNFQSFPDEFLEYLRKKLATYNTFNELKEDYKKSKAKIAENIVEIEEALKKHDSNTKKITKEKTELETEIEKLINENTHITEEINKKEHKFKLLTIRYRNSIRQHQNYTDLANIDNLVTSTVESMENPQIPIKITERRNSNIRKNLYTNNSLNKSINDQPTRLLTEDKFDSYTKENNNDNNDNAETEEMKKSKIPQAPAPITNKNVVRTNNNVRKIRTKF